MAVFDLSNSESVESAQALLTNCIIQGSKVEITRKSGRRTLTQNAALHLCFTQIAEELNASGLDMKRTLKQDAEISWTVEAVKEYMWRPFQIAVTNKESTTELTSAEIDKVFVQLQRYMHQQLGLDVQFPSIDTLIAEQRN